MSSLLNRCHQSDILISEDNQQILKSRFVIPFEKIRSSHFDEGYNLVRDLKRVTDIFPYKVCAATIFQAFVERFSINISMCKTEITSCKNKRNIDNQ